ncbi:MAG: hypothetical protein JO340_14290 [Acidobacteriaceae bacterium]|nr:hypothetical protein [Acidobacteriaceae bacterium]
MRKLKFYVFCSAAATVFSYVGWILATPASAQEPACTCGPASPCPSGYKCGGVCSPKTSQYYGAECIPE